MRTFICSVLALLSCQSILAAENTYPRGELLMEPAQLQQAPADEFVVLDVRSQEEYRQGHIPGAHRVDVGAWKEAFAVDKDPGAWAERIGELGITRDSTVVLYDQGLSSNAARIWWILRYWGVEDARLLNGGWAQWKATGGDVQTETPQSPEPVEFEPAPNENRLATLSSLLDQLDFASLQILDVRSEAEFCGIAQRSNQRGGAIPGATNLEWSELIDPETQRFKTADELRQLFASKGVDLDQPLTTHCQSGGRASVMAFALELMGADKVRNYYAGWSEWGNTDQTPVVKPEPKK